LRLGDLAAGEREELIGEGLGGSDAVLGFLDEAGTDNTVESRGDGRIRTRRRERSRGEDEVADGRDGITVEGIATGEHFIEDHAEREEIRTGILSAAENLFWAPISGSAADRGVRALMASEASHAEVGEFDAIIGSDDDVGGFDVAVDDGAAMRDGKSDGNVSGPFASGGKRNAALGNDFFEGLAFDQFHDEVGSLRGLLDAHVVNGDDAWMRQLCNDACFAEEVVARVAPGEFRSEELDGHGAVDEGVMGTNDAAVGAGAKGFEDLVTSNLQE
jgi:hypothetical protein